jgi:Domain of unknown function (DUF1707)/Cell wall-active antibiotics response 4TMS YvqF
MADTPALRASDADRERMVALLREHATDGRLTLEEFTERISVAYEARTIDELDALGRDLPAAGSPTPRRRRTRLALAVFASNRLEGRLRIGRRVLCLMGFGNIDLDLRRATFDGDVITIVALGMFGAIDVYVPEGIEVDLHGLAVFGHRQARGNEVPPHPGTPLIRVFAFSMFAGIDVWRVPGTWAQRTFKEVIRGIRAGTHKELQDP